MPDWGWSAWASFSCGMRMMVAQALQRTVLPRAVLGTARILRQTRFGHMMRTVMESDMVLRPGWLVPARLRGGHRVLGGGTSGGSGVRGWMGPVRGVGARMGGLGKSEKVRGWGP